MDAQRKRLEKQIEQLDKVIASSLRQLSDQKFLSRAPAPVVDSIRGKLADYEAQLEKSRTALEALLTSMSFDVTHPDIHEAVWRALEEDIGPGDITSQATRACRIARPRGAFRRARRWWWRAPSCCR